VSRWPVYCGCRPFIVGAAFSNCMCCRLVVVPVLGSRPGGLIGTPVSLLPWWVVNLDPLAVFHDEVGGAGFANSRV